MSASYLMCGGISELIGVGGRRYVKGDMLCTHKTWSEFELKKCAGKRGMREREEERKKEKKKDIFLVWVKVKGLEGTCVKVCVSSQSRAMHVGRGKLTRV